jgi:hypothetical protein
MGLNTGPTPKPKAIQPSQLPPPPKFIPRPTDIDDISEEEEDEEDTSPVPPPTIPQVQAFSQSQCFCAGIHSPNIVLLHDNTSLTLA